jgi:hypothetical protein
MLSKLVDTLKRSASQYSFYLHKKPLYQVKLLRIRGLIENADILLFQYTPDFNYTFSEMYGIIHIHHYNFGTFQVLL